MSNYNKSTNFAVKDTLTSGDPDKVVSGAEIDNEFNSIASAVTSKADKVAAATTNNFAGLNASGNLIDSGKSSSDFADATATSNSISVIESDITELQNDKADKVAAATTDNFAALDANGNLKDSGENTVSVAPPVGSITMYGGSSAPSGWLYCNGQNVSRTTFANLFSAIGTTFGAGDGSSTFGLPDLRDRFPIGDNSIGGADSSRVSNYNTSLGDSGGEDEHQLSESEMPSHKHSFNKRGDDGVGATGSSFSVVGFDTNIGGGDGDMNNTGGDQPHNNMPPFLAVSFIIKT